MLQRLQPQETPSLSSAQQSFMEAFYQATTACPGDEQCRLFRENVKLIVQCERGVLLTDKIRSDEVILDKIVSCQLRQGHAAKAMEFLTDLADSFGLAIGLMADPIIDDEINEKDAKDLGELMEWYEGFCFKLQRGQRDIMWREPQTP